MRHGEIPTLASFRSTTPSASSRGDRAPGRPEGPGRPADLGAGAVAPGPSTVDPRVEDEPGIREECGVFGVWAPGEEVSRLCYFGLYALQHRGQESAGIATTDGASIRVYKDLGLVSQVFDDPVLTNLAGHMAVAHVRYATTGATTWENAQPMLGPVAGSTLALTHNGNLTNTRELMEAVHAASGEDLTGELGRGSSTDTAVIAALMNLVSIAGAPAGWDHAADRAEAWPGLLPAPDGAPAGDANGGPAPDVASAARLVLPMLRGAYSLVFMDEHTLYAARDPHGVRPLVLGRLDAGWVVASETAALDIVGARFVREIEPGELIEIDGGGVRSTRFAAARRAGCVFEYVYLARPDTRIAGRSIITARNTMGAILAREHAVDADLVIATPESGTPAAIGYAQASGIPYAQGLVKNAYVGRTFIQPTQTLRQLGIRLKLNPVREVIEGKRLVVVDDSIVRGNTQRALVRMLREAGAAEVHIRISSPPVLWPCFYGIDFATRDELIATSMSVDAIRDSIGADSLGYLSVDGMIEASGQPGNELCLACFTGSYPITPPREGVIASAASADQGREAIEPRPAVPSAPRYISPDLITMPDLATGSTRATAPKRRTAPQPQTVRVPDGARPGAPAGPTTDPAPAAPEEGHPQ
ncbi:amidophosphoribosyltransferase [Actinomyces gaoshouyii]|uniref:amidophosphoribosyltransferase n=1 Tax=Actinomyces gaoshouyii TaxID=1960083 RepID=UPI0026A27FCA